MPDRSDRPARLQLLGEVARGGMGVILKGRDSDLGRDLAVKVLLERHRDNPDLIRRFVEEASAGSSRRPRSPASCSTPAWSRSTSWAPSPTTGRISP
jgi:serine/threonine protein kinase